jgi:hypothetical protein
LADGVGGRSRDGALFARAVPLAVGALGERDKGGLVATLLDGRVLLV